MFWKFERSGKYVDSGRKQTVVRKPFLTLSQIQECHGFVETSHNLLKTNVNCIKETVRTA